MYKKIYNKIKEYDTIVIARHIGVDPDALGSQLGLRESIKKTFPNKHVYAVGAGAKNKFKYFPKLDKLETTNGALLIVLDTPDKKRVDISSYDGYDYSIKIDHHPFIEKYCDMEYINPSSSSASELVLNLIYKNSLIIDSEIAEMLFIGIMGDTNRLLFSTSKDTLRLVYKLIKDYELDMDKLFQNLYMRPLNEIRLEGYIGLNMTVTDNGLSYIKINNDIITSYGVDVGSAGNIINNFNNIEEVLVWVIVSEDIKNNLYKFNIRSRGPVINTVAEKYNGGGHKFAAGARISNVEDVDKLIYELDEACKDYLLEEELSDEN